MSTLEGKIVQGVVAEVLSAIYEVDILGFSYEFRPGRSPHGALRALHTVLMTRTVNWVLDADIRSSFDSVTTSGCCGSFPSELPIEGFCD